MEHLQYVILWNMTTLNSTCSTHRHTTSYDLNIHWSVHSNNILLYKSQQDARVTEFILSDNCSTCFGR
jgi:hypothetical protein